MSRKICTFAPVFMPTTMRNAKILLLIFMAIIALQVQTVSAAELPEGALPGVFSTGSRQVRFSIGNLQYCAATDTWRFAPRQYAIVGEDGTGNVGHPTRDGVKSDNLMVSQTYDGWIDLFGWGTSGWQSGANVTQPWNTDDDPTHYVPQIIIDSVPRPDHYNMEYDFVNLDWGVYNPISNGGNRRGMWRTLTREEWRYILQERPNYENLRGQATINGSHGMVLLPDNWETPWGASFDPGYGLGWDTNEYSYAEWKVLEDAGAVFLPCAGCRTIQNHNLHVENLNTAGHYWTSSSFLGGGLTCAFDLYFNSFIPEMYTYDMRCWGESVRLVMDIR